MNYHDLCQLAETGDQKAIDTKTRIDELSAQAGRLEKSSSSIGFRFKDQPGAAEGFQATEAIVSNNKKASALNREISKILSEF